MSLYHTLKFISFDVFIPLAKCNLISPIVLFDRTSYHEVAV